MDKEFIMYVKTKKLALDTIRFCGKMGKDNVSRVISNQLLRCGTSVGANYRAASKARSKADFIAKMGIVEEESDETCYWLELIEESGLLNKELTSQLRDDADHVLAMAVKSIITARNNLKNRN